MGHTTVMWDNGAVGYTGGDKGRDDGDEIRNANSTGRPISAYAVAYRPRTNTATKDHEAWFNMSIPHTYGAGPKAGQCCPVTPNCDDIKACLKSLIGQPWESAPRPSSGRPIDERPNCNSFAADALRKCCLMRGELILDNYPARNYRVTNSGNEGNNLGWQWTLFP